MRKQIEKIIATAIIFVLTITAFNFKSFAYSEIPEYFDFEQCCLSMDAGSSRVLWMRSTYKYDAFVGNHTSSKTYIECSEKAGSHHIVLHIGPDEQEKNVFFYFYVDDSEVEDKSLYDCIEVYVQNIDTSYAQKADMAAPLKWYANNNSEFNAYDYYMNYPDLQNAFGTDGDALFTHFYQSGKAEHRVANKLL